MSYPSVRRAKTMDLTPVGPERYRLSGRLTDTSFHGDYGPDDGADDQARDRAVIHDFLVEGELLGPDLVVTALDVTAESHPYRQCPAILPSCRALIGRSIASGWRSTVLQLLGGTAGCTHVTTLLLGLAEARTMAIFLEMNTETAYSARNRSDGPWTARALAVAPAVSGACHALDSAGPIVLQARAITDADDAPSG